MRFTTIVLVSVFSAAASGAEPARYTVLLSGNRAGEQTVLRLPSGDLQVHFEFNDRGRGPKIDERVAMDARGWPVSVEITGIDYFKGAVAERFRRDGATAAWKSDVEQGEALADSGFYVSFNGAPVESGLLASALLRSPDRRVPLLPGGGASIEEAGEQTVRKGGVERVVREPLPGW